MTTNKAALYNAILRMVDQKECEDGMDIPLDEYTFVIATLTNFVENAITKYIQGAKVHAAEGSFLRDRDHKAEARNEIIDMMFYLEAMNNKKN